MKRVSVRDIPAEGVDLTGDEIDLLGRQGDHAISEDGGRKTFRIHDRNGAAYFLFNPPPREREDGFYHELQSCALVDPFLEPIGLGNRLF
jgi:hypothetical protein